MDKLPDVPTTEPVGEVEEEEEQTSKRTLLPLMYNYYVFLIL